MKNNIASFLKSLRSSKKTILLIVIVSAATLIISSIIAIWLSYLTNINIPTIGTIRTQGVEAYWDSNLTNKTKTYDWGTTWPGTSKNITLYLRSLSNFETTLSLTTGNWTFLSSNNSIVAGPSSATPYMNLTWDYNNTKVRPSEAIRVSLTLSISRSADFVDFLVANDVRKFSVDILIRASR